MVCVCWHFYVQQFQLFSSILYVIGDLGVNLIQFYDWCCIFPNGTFPPTVEAAAEVDLIIVQVLLIC